MLALRIVLFTTNMASLVDRPGLPPHCVGGMYHAHSLFMSSYIMEVSVFITALRRLMGLYEFLQFESPLSL